MLDSLPDKALELASSLASLGFEAAAKGVQSLASLIGVNPAIIVAGAAGLIVFILVLKVFSSVK